MSLILLLGDLDIYTYKFAISCPFVHLFYSLLEETEEG